MKISIQTLISVMASVLLLNSVTTKLQAQGTWTAIATAAPHTNGGGMLLLSDGTVLVKSFSGGADGYGNTYDKLTPNASGSYVNGTWSSIAPMANTRLYYSSQVLKDGRVYVAGGEYGTGGSLGEVYDPLTNVWTNCPAQGSFISDANSEILEDGRVLQALVTGNLKGTKIYDPVNNTFSNGPTALGIHNESAWIKLPDNSILYVNRLSTSSERYIPATNSWIADATVPVQLYDAFGDETGGALLLPDGRALFLGSAGHNAYYTPSGTTAPGTWVAAPDFPNASGTPDAPAAMMVNGKVLCNASPVPTSGNHFPSPTTFYEFDPVANSFTAIPTPGGGASINVSCYVTNMLDLPDGTVLYGRQNTNTYYVYTPSGSPVATGKPTIGTVTQTGTNTYSITGTLFNGISQGATYGDDWQMSSNYPIVRLTSGSNVYYARTSNWNSTGVRRGSAADTATFTLPAGLPNVSYSLYVVANGIASNPVAFSLSPTAFVSIGLTSGSNPSCSSASVTFTATPTNGGTTPAYQWKVNGGNVGTNSDTYTTTSLTNGQVVTCVMTSNMAGVLGNPATSNGLSQVINPLPSVSFSGLSANYTVTASAATLTGSPAGGTFSGPGISGNTFAPATAGVGGPYTILYAYTDANGCSNSSSQQTTVAGCAVPSVPNKITGQSFGVCNLSGIPFSVPNVAGVTFNWSFSNGLASVQTGQGTRNITANFLNGFTTGTLSVTASNGCGTSAAKSKTIKAMPTTPGNITGATLVCPNQAGVPYSISAVPNSTVYTWTGPPGSHISDGLTTSTGAILTTSTLSVSVNFGNTIGTLKVKAKNGCGSGNNKTLAIGINAGCRESSNSFGIDEMNLIVYPNPVSSELHISFYSENVSFYSIDLKDVLGKIQFKLNGTSATGENNFNIPVDRLSKGIYFLEVNTGDKKNRSRVVVN